jgi:hypothetical protein
MELIISNVTIIISAQCHIRNHITIITATTTCTYYVRKYVSPSTLASCVVAKWKKLSAEFQIIVQGVEFGM